MKPITAIVLGAGNRGSVYTGYAVDHAEEFSVVAIADPRTERLNALADKEDSVYDFVARVWNRINAWLVF